MSNVTVTLTFASVDEAISFLSRRDTVIDAPASNAVELCGQVVGAIVKETKPRGRKAPKTQPEVVENTGSGASPVAPVEHAAANSDGQPLPSEGSAGSPVAVDPVADAAGEATGGVATLDDVRAALALVNEKKGLLFARELVAKFHNAKGEPCGRVSEIQEADYAVVIAACHKAVA